MYMRTLLLSLLPALALGVAWVDIAGLKTKRLTVVEAPSSLRGVLVLRPRQPRRRTPFFRPNSPTVAKGDTVTVHATGVVKETDKKFWSTKDPGQQPFTYQAGVGGVITGWDQGLLGASVGETRKLDIPAAEGYGARGFPAWGIPPNVRRSVLLARAIRETPIPVGRPLLRDRGALDQREAGGAVIGHIDQGPSCRTAPPRVPSRRKAGPT